MPNKVGRYVCVGWEKQEKKEDEDSSSSSYVVLLDKQLNREQAVSIILAGCSRHHFRNPQLLILNIPHELVDTLDLLQIVASQHQWPLDLGKPGGKYIVAM